MHIPVILPLAIMMCGSAVLITGMRLISRQLSVRRMASPTQANDELTRRLERIEQAVETTAIEIERMAEANRFLTKLLSQKSDIVPR
jgi:chromosome segregation and condensation protein ScpB